MRWVKSLHTDERGMTLFEVLITLLVLLLVAVCTIFVVSRINHNRAESDQRVRDVQNLVK